MKTPTVSHLIKLILLCLGLSLAKGKVYADDCSLPPRVTEVKIDGILYLKGEMSVPIDQQNTRPINLYIEKTEYPDDTSAKDRCAAEVYTQTREIFIELYQDYLTKGVTTENIQILADSISGLKTSGVYINKDPGACTYSGAPRRINCGPTSTDALGKLDQKTFMSHENMHGWQFQFNTNIGGIHFYMAFAHFANHLYNTKNPLNYDDPEAIPYGLQNQYEWGAEVFSDWLLDTNQGKIWPYIDKNLPKYKTYFNCLWKTNNSPSSCAEKLGNPIKLATVDPTQTPPNKVVTTIRTPDGDVNVEFNKAYSQAIWNVCFDRYKNSASPDDYSVLSQITQYAAPGLPDDAAYYYKLMYADANHDNVIDWLCEYDGPGPSGVGDGYYLWNSENKFGTYTFIVSGDPSNPYVEYKQDPYLTYPSINGSLGQPQFREWQGEYGSANGASQFDYHIGYDWYRVFASFITPGKISAITPNGRKCLDTIGAAGRNVGVTLTNCAFAPAWIKQADGRIRLLDPGANRTYCLDVNTAGPHPRDVQIWGACEDSTPINQVWTWSGDGPLRLNSKNMYVTTTESESGQVTIAPLGAQCGGTVNWRLDYD